MDEITLKIKRLEFNTPRDSCESSPALGGMDSRLRGNDIPEVLV